MWLEKVQMYGDMTQTVIVGNKCDLEKAVDDDVSNILSTDAR